MPAQRSHIGLVISVDLVFCRLDQNAPCASPESRERVCISFVTDPEFGIIAEFWFCLECSLAITNQRIRFGAPESFLLLSLRHT